MDELWPMRQVTRYPTPVNRARLVDELKVQELVYVLFGPGVN